LGVLDQPLYAAKEPVKLISKEVGAVEKYNRKSLKAISRLPHFNMARVSKSTSPQN
jgi:hypothetical protein